MKIQSNKNNNINEESIHSLQDFRKKQIITNIRYHIIFLTLLIIINIGLTIFIIFYKTKINSLKSKTSSYYNQIDKGDATISNLNTVLTHKLVNMGLLNQYGLIRFSFIFEKSDEFKTVQNVIYDYRKEVEKREVPIEYRSTFLLFEGMMDNYDKFLDRVAYFWNLAIFIETLENKKFGIFLSDIIAPIKENEFQTESKNIIMYSFDTKKKYNYIGDGKKVLSINKDGKMLVVGDDELIIYDDFYMNGGEINFPMKSFDFSTVNSNVLTGENGKFSIKNIEAFCFSQIQF
jgi:cell division protein FtsL